ncbi:MAG: redoxin domain-containing protein [Chitinophagales bacterium]
MKNISLAAAGFLLCLLAFPFNSYSQKQGYQIIIHIPAMKDTPCYLANYYGDKQYIQDTVLSDVNGTVVFEGREQLPGGIYLFVFPDKRYFEMLVDKEQYFTMETKWDDPINNMKVKGSKDNDLFYEYLKFAVQLQKNSMEAQERLKTASSKADTTSINDQLKANDEKMTAYRKKYMQDHPETFLTKIFTTMPEPEIPKEIPTLPNGRKDSTYAYRFYKGHYLDNVDFSDSRLLRTPLFAPKIEKYIKELTPQVPDSINKEAVLLVEKAKADSELFKYVLWWITYNYETSKIMGMDEVFVHMVEKYYMTGQAYWLDSAQLVKIIDRARKIAPNIIGNTAPELALKDTLGQWQILSKVPAKYTILVFWDPDCGHCQKEMPKLKEVYDKWKSKGVEIYAVDIEVDDAKWKKFIREKKLDWINVNDINHQSNFRQLYDIYSTPVIYILDDKKVIRAKRIGADQIDEFLNHLESSKAKKS